MGISHLKTSTWYIFNCNYLLNYCFRNLEIKSKKKVASTGSQPTHLSYLFDKGAIFEVKGMTKLVTNRNEIIIFMFHVDMEINWKIKVLKMELETLKKNPSTKYFSLKRGCSLPDHMNLWTNTTDLWSSPGERFYIHSLPLLAFSTKLH